MRLLTDYIKHTYEKLIQAGFKTFFYGSTVRKWLLRETPNIYYILTEADIIDLAKLFETIEFPGRTYFDAEMRKSHHIVRFRKTPPHQGEIDLKFLKDQSKIQSLTIDTFFYDPTNDTYIDPCSSYMHLRKKILYPTPQFRQIFQIEPTKIFDILSLACQYDFTITKEITEVCEKFPFHFSKDHSEDVQIGLNSILTAKYPYSGIDLMNRFNILTEIVPELENTKSVPQDKDHHPEGNVYEHTLECFKYIENPSLELSMALLLHDIGKPKTACMQKKNLSFPNHQKIGAQIAQKILRRIGYDNDLISSVTFLIHHHLLTHEFHTLGDNQRKHLMEHPLFPELLRLFKADVSSCYGDLSNYHRINSLYRKLKIRYNIIEDIK